MKPIKFKEQNCTFAENQDEYLPLPAFKVHQGIPNGAVVFCQYLSFWERLRVLFTGKIWVELLTFHNPLQPGFFTTRKRDLFALGKTPIRLILRWNHV